MSSAARPKPQLLLNDTPETSQASHRGCKMALRARSPHLTQEIESLLLRRLRLASAIMAVAFASFIVLSFVKPRDDVGPFSTPRILQVSTGIIIAVIAVLLWSIKELGLFWLRLLEVAFFGTIAGYFAWAHHIWFQGGMPAAMAVDGKQTEVVHMAGAAVAMRWFALIVLYGTFIPNTWRRCALVVGLLTALPVALNVWVCVYDPVNGPPLRSFLGELSIILLVASAIAIFGSHKIRELHEQAFEAAKLGHYRLKRKLGAGGMGEVYLAEHVLLRRPCAIKMIRPDQAGDGKLLKRFEREVQAMATLTHWNTVEVYEYGHAQCGSFYYVMEYLPGWSLEDLVASKGALPPARVVHVLRQVCGALREAHAVGLVHRDIKASNLIICERGKVYDVTKLLDFGLVKHHNLEGDDTRLTQQGVLSGTPAYMSPEQAMGLPEVDARSDIYSLGAVAYYLLTGSVPFERKTVMQTLTAHARDPVRPLRELNPAVPADVEQVVLRCLEKEPGKRYQDAESLEEALAACACAGQWAQEHARAWWQRNDSPTDSVDTAETPKQTAPTVLASPALAAAGESAR